jgi:hypothetical protein
MTARKISAVQRRKTKGLKLKKETIRDLSARPKARGVKGGGAVGARGAFRNTSVITAC